MKNILRREWAVPKGTTLEGREGTQQVSGLRLGSGRLSYSQRQNEVLFVTDKGLVPTGATLVREKRPFGAVEWAGAFSPKEGRTRVGQVMADIARDPNQLYLEGVSSSLTVPGMSRRSK